MTTNVSNSRLKNLVLTILFLPLAWACSPADTTSTEQVIGSPTGSEAGSTLLRGARLVIGDGSVIENGALLIADGLIQQIGTTAEVQAPADATVISLEGKTIIPALIDAHSHLGYEGYTSWGSDNYSRANMIEHLERYAYYGFAAVFSAGSDPDDFALELQQAQSSGEVGGARFLFAAGMAPPGQGPNPQFLSHALAVADVTGMTVLRGAGSPEQGRAAVQEVADKGITRIKIWVDDRRGTQVKLAPEIYRAIIAEARLNNIDVYVHQQTALDMPDLLQAGVKGFLHGRFERNMTAELASQIKQSNAFLIPNLGLGELSRERIADDPFLQQAVSPAVVAKLGASFDARPPVTSANESERESAEAELRAGFAHLLAAGVDITLGTDAGAVPDHFFGYTGHRELEIYVRLGMSPMQALIAATATPAKVLGLVDMGTLTIGKRADLVVLDANPLSDIRNTQSISQVFLQGQLLNRDDMSSRWTAQP